MTYFDKEKVDRWRGMVESWLLEHTPGVTRHDVYTGVEAWDLACVAGILHEAYADHNAIDAHIQTALESIFPNCVFKDKKVY